jgi:glycosyltransferase involved in cell wall biosynthesis
MRTLRILHVVPYYEQAWAYGGIPRLATTITRALARRGHAVTVCTTDVRDSRTRASRTSLNQDGVDVRMFRNASNAVAYHFQFFTPVGLGQFLRNAAGSFDIAHLHACHNLPVVIAAWELRRAGVPYVVSPNGTAPAIERRIKTKRLFAMTVGRSLLPRAARVTAVSHAEVLQLRALGVDAASIVRIPNPIDEAEFVQPLDPERCRRQMQVGDAPLVLFLGKLTPRKGVDDLVRAVALLRDTRIRLIIAGNDMGIERTLLSLIRRLGLVDRVTLVGLLTARDRLDALAAADVVVYPSRDEIFGLVPLEALLAGTPVVVCNDSGCGEVIAETGGGCLTRPGDITALASAIERVLGDVPAWRADARAGAVSARRLFGTQVVCEQLESLYSGILHEQPAAERMRA